MNLLNGTGLDGRSVLVGAGLVLAGMVAAKGEGLIPLLLVGGIVYMIGSKKGWWGQRKNGARRGPFSGPPAVFEEWHRQTHATPGQPWSGHGHGAEPARAAWQGPVPPAPPAPPTPETPQEAEIRIPVTQAPGYSRTVGESGENVA
jgi:hypothetical protein